LYEGESNENLKYIILNIKYVLNKTAEHHGRYGMLIHDSYPDVRRFPFTMASTAAIASEAQIGSNPEKNYDNLRHPIHSESFTAKCTRTKEYKVRVVSDRNMSV
jgi:hypothetical protein